MWLADLTEPETRVQLTVAVILDVMRLSHTGNLGYKIKATVDALDLNMLKVSCYDPLWFDDFWCDLMMFANDLPCLFFFIWFPDTKLCFLVVYHSKSNDQFFVNCVAFARLWSTFILFFNFFFDMFPYSVNTFFLYHYHGWALLFPGWSTLGLVPALWKNAL